MSVTVVGGGIAGLSAAFELHRRGVPFALHEAATRLGGIIRTDYLPGFVIDAGPDAMLARKRAGIALCEEVGIAHRLVPANPPRTAFVLRGGVLAPLPSWPQPAAAPAAPDESIASYFERTYGRDAVDYFAEPVLAGIHAGDVHRLSVRALFPEIAGREPEGARHNDATPVDPEGAFRSFPRGMQELVDALAAALPRDAVRTATPARQLREHLREGPVILAVPGSPAAGLLDPIDPALATLCRRIPYVSSGIVVLAYPRKAVSHSLSGSGFVVPRAERGTRILAATWLSSKWPGRAPADVALLRAFFGGARDPASLSLSDDALVAMAHGDLARLLQIDAEPSLRRVYRWLDATPQYEVGYLETLAAIRAAAARIPGLHLAGAAFGSIGIPDCIQSGRAAARAALEG
ncbi:MAG TPA: protoporphyrinogen oxidase [Vicinamibacterales bacterium]|nr:protoporphyrinogen oxidase [Vicinamibacterales bacterium]